jgi:hypothetical protein
MVDPAAIGLVDTQSSQEISTISAVATAVSRVRGPLDHRQWTHRLPPSAFPASLAIAAAVASVKAPPGSTVTDPQAATCGRCDSPASCVVPLSASATSSQGLWICRRPCQLLPLVCSTISSQRGPLSEQDFSVWMLRNGLLPKQNFYS